MMDEDYVAELRGRIIELQSLLYRELKIRDEAHTQLHDAESKALIVAREAMVHRLDAMNEFRNQLRDQNATFVTHEAVRLMREATLIKVNEIEMVQRQLKSAQDQLNGRLWMLGAGLTVMIAALGAFLGLR